VQTAAKLLLEPIFEADFDPNAYGYRPKRRAQVAIQKVHKLLCAVSLLDRRLRVGRVNKPGGARKSLGTRRILPTGSLTASDGSWRAITGTRNCRPTSLCCTQRAPASG
jgi:hypothetical protein